MRISVQNDVFQLAKTFRISRGAKSQVEVLTVRISEGANTGYGECVPYARYGESIASVRAQIESLPEEFDHNALAGMLPAGAARNGVDCALWDLRAKQAGVRVWQLLGRQISKPLITAYSLSLESAEIMLANAAENAFRPLLKIKLGKPDDMNRLEAVRKGAPNSSIIVDANEGWSAEVYKDLAPHLVKLGVLMVEQPLPADNDDFLLEIDHPIPICADESCHDRSTLPSLKGKYEMINIKLDKTGGLTEAFALDHAARSLGYDIMVGCMVSSSLSMAPAHVVAQGAKVVDLDGPLLLAEDRDPPLKFDNDGVHPPNAELWG